MSRRETCFPFISPLHSEAILDEGCEFVQMAKENGVNVKHIIVVSISAS